LWLGEYYLKHSRQHSSRINESMMKILKTNFLWIRLPFATIIVGNS
jgi:hypothetical protein